MSNQDNQNINSKDFLIGSLIGGIVGASMALLFAPKSGKELRSNLNQSANYVKDRAYEWKDIAYEKGSEWKDVAKDNYSQLSETVSEKSHELGDKVKETSKSIQDRFTQEEDPEKAAEEVAQAIEAVSRELDEQQNYNNNQNS
ncbi:YtxH domain-containing protein [Aquibacillus salsiterrae]|uniref:YtxH domain-containing protein n=1 Tax=Aquibacillus salsiterrae TaxID=2950439 RepID=A0A9X3WCF5_9BACI|nr:YtxH domain-containing protein [Aquibacillus salsiterrae]MDC3415791.1 YtxH domain-containing protein [Aquibacillus salsiterrae]